MGELIQNAGDLQSWLTGLQKLNSHHRDLAIKRSIIVSTKVRKEFLLSENQGRFILSGEVLDCHFLNIGGGCWKIEIRKLSGEPYGKI